MWLIAKLKVKLDESECIPDAMIPHKKYIASLKLMSFSMRETANMVTKNREKCYVFTYRSIYDKIVLN